ncbi:MAG: PAC2 family protein, partial [Chloroflexi bacterium]|nr:PAC2 family protein [Chloroflexota bacterium]
YTGPTGVASAIIEAAQDRGISYASLWGHVPHYIQTSPNPAVIQAILENLRQAFGIAVDLEDLEGQTAAFRDRCEQAISQEPSMRAYVRRLEQYFDEAAGESSSAASSGTAGSSEMPSPQDLVEDLENFLRQRRAPDTSIDDDS